MNNDAVAVGDLNSNARGSGARKNGGKEAMDLIPVRYWKANFTHSVEDISLVSKWFEGLGALAAWQEGELYALWSFLATQDLHEAVAVFEFGAQKYAMWNWAKGMPWRVPLGSALRHAKARLQFNEVVDQDSGQSHWGHFLCNIIMLDYYADNYPEGDDRPIFPETTL